MNYTDLRFDTDLEKAISDFDFLLSHIGDCKKHLSNCSELEHFESAIVEMVESLEVEQTNTQWLRDAKKELEEHQKFIDYAEKVNKKALNFFSRYDEMFVNQSQEQEV
jgi:hypothetical protein